LRLKLLTHQFWSGLKLRILKHRNGNSVGWYNVSEAKRSGHCRAEK